MATKTLQITMVLTLADLSDMEMLLLRDLIKVGGDSTMLTENMGLYDFKVAEKITAVEAV